jgi:hypothetical protein
MSTQNYDNHTHRPFPTALGAALWAVAVCGVVASWRGAAWGPTLAWTGVLLCLFTVLATGRLYTTKLQDRIIMLEERLRASTLLTPAQLARWGELTPKQIAALRFACDAEMPALFDKTVADRLKPDAIKRAVATWRPDTNRT